MNSRANLLSAGLPGLMFGVPPGRNLSIEVNQELEIPSEDIACIKNATLPTGMLAIHLFKLNDLPISEPDIILYATFTVASIWKTSKHQKCNVKTSEVVFDELKLIPFTVNPISNDQMNKLIMTVYCCKRGEESLIPGLHHKVVGRHESHLYKLLKNTVTTENANLLGKNGVITGSIEFECCVLYGAFGYGNSYQLRSNKNPVDIVGSSLFPRIPPEEDDTASYRGVLLSPRKIKHPDFIPLKNGFAKEFQPDFSKTKGHFVYSTFPLLKQHLRRMNQLHSTLHEQPTRLRRIGFLKQLLQDEMSNTHVFKEANGDKVVGKDKSLLPIKSFTFLRESTKIFADAPGITEREVKLRPIPSPNRLSVDYFRSRDLEKSRAHRVATESISKDCLVKMDDVVYSNRK